MNNQTKKFIRGIIVSLMVVFFVFALRLRLTAAEPAHEQVLAQSESWRHRVWIWQETNDSLSSLAKQYYGDAREWRRIYEANQDKISDPNVIYPKQYLFIPSLTAVYNPQPAVERQDLPPPAVPLPEKAEPQAEEEKTMQYEIPGIEDDESDQEDYLGPVEQQEEGVRDMEPSEEGNQEEPAEEEDIEEINETHPLLR